MDSLPGHEHLPEEVDWKQNETGKLFVNELLIKKESFAILLRMGNLGHFPEAAEVVLSYRTEFYSNISIYWAHSFIFQRTM